MVRGIGPMVLVLAGCVVHPRGDASPLDVEDLILLTPRPSATSASFRRRWHVPLYWWWWHRGWW